MPTPRRSAMAKIAIEMAVEVAVDADRIEAAHQVGALGDRLVEQLRRCPASAAMPLCGKATIWMVTRSRKRSRTSRIGVEVLEAELVVDVDVAAHVQRAAGHDLAAPGWRRSRSRRRCAPRAPCARPRCGRRRVLPAAWLGTQGRPSRVLSRWMWPSTSGGRTQRSARDRAFRACRGRARGREEGGDPPSLDLDVLPAAVGQRGVG